MHINAAVRAVIQVSGAAPVGAAVVVVVETNAYAGNKIHPVGAFCRINRLSGGRIDFAFHCMRTGLVCQIIPALRRIAPGRHASGYNIGIKYKSAVFIIPEMLAGEIQLHISVSQTVVANAAAGSEIDWLTCNVLIFINLRFQCGEFPFCIQLVTGIGAQITVGHRYGSVHGGIKEMVSVRGL